MMALEFVNIVNGNTREVGYSFFLPLFNVRAMFNQYCDRLDKKQPDSERG